MKKFFLAILLTMTFGHVVGQSITRVFGNDCIGNSNEFQFDCGSLTSYQCTFSSWAITGNYTIESASGNIIDVHWNSGGPGTVTANYFSQSLGYNLNASYSVSITSPLTPSVTLAISSSPNPVCASSSIQFTATPVNGGTTPYYNWYINGVNKSNGATNTFTWANWSNNDVVTVDMTSSLNCVTAAASSTGLTISVTPPPQVSVVISTTSICGSSPPQTIHAEPINGGSSPTYSWYRNGSGVGGFVNDQYGSTYTPSPSLQVGDKIQCSMVSNMACASSTAVLSAMAVVYAGIPPNITVTPSAWSICTGDPLTFTLSCDQQTTTGYTITCNGNTQTLAVGTNQFTVPGYLSNSNYDVTVSVGVTGSCLSTLTPSTTFSASQITVSSIPGILLSPLPGPIEICSTCSQTIDASIRAGNPGTPVYQWYNGTTAISGAVSESYTTSQAGSYSVSIALGACPSTPSAQVVLTKNIAPVVSAGPNVTITLPNASVTLQGTATDADGFIRSYAWSQLSDGSATLSGVSTPTLTVTNLTQGTYVFQLQVTDDFGESRAATVSVQVNGPPNYVMESTVMVTGKTTAGDLTGLPVDQMNVNTTFYDGLGRKMQEVTYQGSPQKSDMVQPVVYDQYGREAVKYLPYASLENHGGYKNSALSDQPNFYQTGVNTAVDSQPYSQTIFEPSPLDRPAKDGGPGTVWQPNTNPDDYNDRSIKKSYDVNLASDNVLIWKYDPASGLITQDGNSFQYYGAGQLTVNKTTDEHGNETIDYTDKLKHKILRKVQYGMEGSVKLYTCTYYVYDDFGNLVIVVPPEAVKRILEMQ